MACTKYQIKNNGNQTAYGIFNQCPGGQTINWSCIPGQTINFCGEELRAMDPNYFENYCTVLQLGSCGDEPVPVPTDIEILEVQTTEDFGDRITPLGTATIIASGNSGGPIEYSINNLDWKDSNLFSKLRAGAFTAWARYKNNPDAKASLLFRINRPVAKLFGYAKTLKDASVVGAADGEAQVVINSGSGNYTVKFNHEATVHNLQSGFTMQSMTKTGLIAGNYVATITDIANGSTMGLAFTIKDPITVEQRFGTFLEVPMLNSLHYVIEKLLSPQTPDNRLLRNQSHAHYQKTNYFQPVIKDAFLKTQINTDYENVKAELFEFHKRKFVKAFDMPEMIEENIGATRDFPIRIENHTVAGQCRVYFATGYPPIPPQLDKSFEILNNAEGFNGVYKPVTIAIDPNLGYEYIVITKAWTLTTDIQFVSATGRFDSSLDEFNVLDFTHRFLDVPSGCYYILITAHDKYSQIVAESEPINLQVEFPDFLNVQYHNIDNAFGLSFVHGYVGSLWIPALIGHKRSPGGDRTMSRNSDFSLVKVSARKQRIFTLETFMLPPYMHEKLSVIFDCDNWKINGVQYQASEAYAEPSYIYKALLANSSIKIEQAQWFDKYNSDDIGTVAEGGFIIGNGGRIKR